MPPSPVCEMAFWSAALFMTQTHKEDQRRMKNSEFGGVFPLLNPAASQTWAVMASLRALSSLSWLSSPLHRHFGWREAMGSWLKGSAYTLLTAWRHATHGRGSADWNSFQGCFLFPLTHCKFCKIHSNLQQNTYKFWILNWRFLQDKFSIPFSTKITQKTTVFTINYCIFSCLNKIAWLQWFLCIQKLSVSTTI